MKICFVWFWDKAPSVYDNWRDGLRSAIELIGQEHQVHWIIGKEYPEDDYDAILFWDDSNSSFFDKIDQYKGKKGIFLTTDPHNFDNLRKLDVVFCESEPVYEKVRAQGIRAVRAFGTDIDFFTPGEVEKDIEYFYPATFSPWKRQSELRDLRDKLLLVGTVQPDGWLEFDMCKDAGCKIEEGYFPAEKIRDYYQRSKKVLIPAVHGSERTILEAMACGIVPIVRKENKAYSYIQELEESGLSPREFVEKNYSHYKYAENILKTLI